MSPPELVLGLTSPWQGVGQLACEHSQKARTLTLQIICSAAGAASGSPDSRPSSVALLVHMQLAICRERVAVVPACCGSGMHAPGRQPACRSAAFLSALVAGFAGMQTFSAQFKYIHTPDRHALPAGALRVQ